MVRALGWNLPGGGDRRSLGGGALGVTARGRLLSFQVTLSQTRKKHEGRSSVKPSSIQAQQTARAGPGGRNELGRFEEQQDEDRGGWEERPPLRRGRLS